MQVTENLRILRVNYASKLSDNIHPFKKQYELPILV